MALVQEAMAAGAPSLLANMVASDPPLTGLVATGTNQATALVLASSLSLFATVAAGTGCLLPTANEEFLTGIFNGGANPLTVYPFGSEAVNGTTSIAIPAGKTGFFLPMGQGWLANISA